MKSVYKKLVSFDDAVRLARETLGPISGTESVPITESSGRILARNVLAPRNNPPFNRSTMDGYAVHAKDLENGSEANPVLLKVTGESFIGQPIKHLDGEGTCFRISTGAIVPRGADAVVKVENTEDQGNGTVKILESVTPGTNIAEAGSDISCNELLTLHGKVVDTNDVAVFASLGIASVEVFRKLKVSVISTGNELISHTEQYREGSISDANGIAVCNELNSFKIIDATYAGIARDQYDEINGMIEECLARSDIVILSGGSSAGESDLVYRIIDDMKPGLVFHGVLVKPGLPTVLGKSGSKAVIGLPGFPVSSMMIFRTIFLDAILSAAHLYRTPNKIEGVLASKLKLEMGKQNLVPVTVSGTGRKRAYPVPGLSGSISRFISTTGFISLAGDTKFLDAGTEVEVIPWSKTLEDDRPVIAGTSADLGPEGISLEDLPWARFHRMPPRESLVSLRNGDCLMSTFYFTGDFRIADYVKSAMGSDEFYAFAGEPMKFGIASRNHVETFQEVVRSVGEGKTISGPSLKFLENIASRGGPLEDLLQCIRDNLTSYRATGFSADNVSPPPVQSDFTICVIPDSRPTGDQWIRLFDVLPVYVSLERNILERLPAIRGKLKAVN